MALIDVNIDIDFNFQKKGCCNMRYIDEEIEADIDLEL